jgi:DNA-binding GntR family transcriptional regulator
MSTTLEFDSYVIDTLMRDLVGHDRRPSSYLVYLAIAAASSAAPAALSHADLAERTGLSRRAVQIAVMALARRELVRVARSGRTDVAVYRALTPWRRRRRE